MTEWQQPPMTPSSALDQAGYLWYQELPHLPNRFPPTPQSLDRQDIGLERFLSPNGTPVSLTVSPGSEANMNVGNRQAMITGRSHSVSPPRSLLPRLLELSQTRVTMSQPDQVQQMNMSGSQSQELENLLNLEGSNLD